MKPVFEKRVLMQFGDEHLQSLSHQEDGYDRSVNIHGIPIGTSKDEMRDIFGATGKLLSFRIAYDPNASNPVPYGKASYTDRKAARRAVNMFNMFDFNGQTLAVTIMTGFAILLGKVPIFWVGDQPSNAQGDVIPETPRPKDPLLEENQKKLKELLSMPDEQIAKLQPNIRNAILRRKKLLAENKPETESTAKEELVKQLDMN